MEFAPKFLHFLRFAATPIVLHITVTALSQINLFHFQDYLHLLKGVTNSDKNFYQTFFLPLGPRFKTN